MRKTIGLVLVGFGMLTACATEQVDAVHGRGAGGALPCGQAMTTIDGVAAYSNGACQGNGNCNCVASPLATGYGYQCVELVQRYFATRFGFPSIWGGVNDAIDMCAAARAFPGRAEVHAEGSYQPVHGDLMVIGPTASNSYGHVAIVDSVSGSNVNVVEQNSDPSGREPRPRSSAACFIHATANGGASNPSAPAVGGDRCAGRHDAWYCGGGMVSGDPTVVYSCQGGRTVDSHQCATRCVDRGSANDECAEGGGGQPCDCRGADSAGNPISTRTCGERVCGGDGQQWACRSGAGANGGGFVPTGEPCR